ncbi:MAG: flippase [Calditrichaeota bacterium]|nr:flippase [Calditrichota bacterium]
MAGREKSRRNQFSSKNLISESDKNLKLIAAGARIDLVGRIFNALLRYLYVFLLARFLGADGMGVFFLAVVIVEFVSMFSRLGLETGVLKFIPMHKEIGRIKGVLVRSLQFTLTAAIAAAAILWLGADFLAQQVFHKPGLAFVMKIISLGIPFSGMMWIFISGTQAFHTMKYRSVVEFFVNPTLNVVLFLAFIFAGKKLAAPALAYVISFFCAAIVGFLALKKLFPAISNKEIRPQFATRELLHFSLPLVMINILSMVLMWTDTVMVGYFRTAEEVGIYSAAAKTAFFVNFVLMAFTSIFAPRISQLYHQGKIDELERLFKTVTRWIFSLSLPVFLLMILLGKDVLSLFGAKFSSGFFALALLSAGYLINASVGSVRYMLTMAEKEKVALWDTIALSALNVVLNIFFIPRFGINGAAAATAISVMLINWLMLAQVRSYLKIHPYEKAFFKPLLAGILIVIASYFFIQQWGGQLIVLKIFVLTLTVVTGYLIILRILGVDEQDRFVLRALRWK